MLFKCWHTSSVKFGHAILLLFASGEFCLSTDGNMNEQVVGHVLFVDYPPFQLASLPLRMQNTGEQIQICRKTRNAQNPLWPSTEWYNDICVQLYIVPLY